MRVITSGWRRWHESAANVSRLRIFMDVLLDLAQMSNEEEVQLIHGGAPGADALVQQWWTDTNKSYNHLAIMLPEPLVFPADWEQYRQAAGPIRNLQMVTAGADLAVVFVHPESKGTVDLRDKAQRAGIFTLQVDWVDDRLSRPKEDMGALPRVA